MRGRNLLLLPLLALALLATPGTGEAQPFWYSGPDGWYYPNVSWPSPAWHFTYAAPGGGYRVFYPGGLGASYVIRPTPATLELRVPDGKAEVWLEGTKMAATGTTRSFVTPPLDPGGRYEYEVRARWKDGDREVTQTRTVTILAGQEIRVDFRTPVAAKPSKEVRAKFDRFVDRLLDPEETLDLKVGRPRLWYLKQAPFRIQVGDERVMGYTLIGDSTREVSLEGRRAGSTVLNLWFGDKEKTDDQTVLSYLVRVAP